MKISELIALLEQQKTKYGDLDCYAHGAFDNSEIIDSEFVECGQAQAVMENPANSIAAADALVCFLGGWNDQ
jgi:hypothetical protein